jgi:hypothetical protein
LDNACLVGSRKLLSIYPLSIYYLDGKHFMLSFVFTWDGTLSAISTLNVLTGVDLAIAVIGFEAKRQKNKKWVAYAKFASFVFSILASIIMPPHGSCWLRHAWKSDNGDGSSWDLFQDPVNHVVDEFLNKMGRILNSQAVNILSVCLSILVPPIANMYFIELGCHFQKKEPKKPLEAMSIPELIPHPGEEVFFRQIDADKILSNRSLATGKLILSNHRVIFDSDDFHEYPLSQLKKVEKDDGSQNLVLKFSGNNKAHFKLKDKETRGVFERILKRDY